MCCSLHNIMSSIELWITLASQICLYLLTIFPQINMLMISIKAGLIFKNNYSTENQVLIFFMILLWLILKFLLKCTYLTTLLVKVRKIVINNTMSWKHNKIWLFRNKNILHRIRRVGLEWCEDLCKLYSKEVCSSIQKFHAHRCNLTPRP